MRVKTLTVFAGLFSLTVSACQRPIQMTAAQKNICPSDNAKGKQEVRFWDKRPALPDGIACVGSPVSADEYSISSRYRDPKHPFQPGNHTGTDFDVPERTNIHAISSGVIAYADMDKRGTNTVVVDMEGGWKYKVLHLRKILVKKGDKVEAGDVIGLSGGAVGTLGSGPCTTGPHLHLALYKDGKYVNFEEYLCMSAN